MASTDKQRLALLKRANKLFRQGKSDAAVKEYQQILAIKPDDLEVRRIVGDLQLRQNNMPGAIEQFEWIADYYLKEGFFAKAIAMYKRITRVNPNYDEALFKLADLYTRQGLVIEAKQIYLDMAEECKRQGNQKKALGMYKKILEFDRQNTKMRTLLADNYLKEGMQDNAVEEYAIAADILLNKKDYRRAEELLLTILQKLNTPKIIEKLLHCYTAQNNDDKAIELLSSLGQDLFKHVNLLKILGELYLKKNMMTEAEKIFIKIAELDPQETEVIVRLGKVYLQREEYDKTYQLFLPIIDKNIKINKFEEAASLLRLIIASNNSYLQALTKLASIFKISGKTNNLIALYESLIPVYERKGMRDELKRVLEELIQLSDTPFTYEEQLERLTGQVQAEKEEEEHDERESEFVSFNLRLVDESLQVNDVDKAVNILVKAKTTFPRNLAVRLKLFQVLESSHRFEEAVEEGKGLLDIYKSLGMRDEYTELFDQLAQLKPEDDKLVEISVDEKTSIDIDFQREELVEEINAFGASDMHDEIKLEDGASDELMVLSEDQSLAPELQMEGPPRDEGLSKSLTTYLSELDFYINDKYFDEAEKLIADLRKQFPGNEELLARIHRLNSAKAAEAEPGQTDGDTLGGAYIDLESDMMPAKEEMPEHDDGLKGHTEPIFKKEESHGFLIESSGSDRFPPMQLDYEDSKDEINLGEPEPLELGVPDDEFQAQEPLELGISDDQFSSPEEIPLGMDIEEPMDMGIPDMGSAFEEEGPPMEFGGDMEPDSAFEIERDIAEESHSAQEFEDSKIGLNVGNIQPPDQVKIRQEEFSDLEDVDFEIEVDEPAEIADLPAFEINKEDIIQSPTGGPREKTGEIRASSGVEDLNLDLDNVIMEESSPSAEMESDSPFREIGGSEIGYDSDEDLLREDDLFLEAAYFEIEKIAPDELEAILFWLQEVEKQRTSTIEKNMMEIFDEFKKGVDEKIGHEDYDTRYNLGIAYKEMGLLEEAIHEFLISSKHPVKFFDSAGLLGMCFREKGMFSEAANWFEKAAATPDRKHEEYLAVKFELVITYNLQEDFASAKKYAEDILRIDSGYRNIADIYDEIKKKINR
jgi:tetratricopeptide (TPR) repeat protein